MNGKQSVLSAGDVNLDSRCIDFLRCVLIVFVVLIHTNLVADTSCEDSVYARGYDIMGNLLWLCNPLFFAISGYLFFYSVDFSGKVYAGKMKRRLHSLLVPYFLWNTIYLLLFSAVYQFAPSAIGPYVVPIQEMGPVDFLRNYFCVYGDSVFGGPIDGPLWFIRDLMILSVLTPVLYAIIRLHRLTLLLFIALYLWHPEGVMLGSLIFFAIGCYLSIWRINPFTISQKWGWVAIVLFLLCAGVKECLPLQNGVGLMAVFLLMQLSGMLTLTFLVMCLLQRCPNAFPQTLAKSLFFVFALHSIIARFLTKTSAAFLMSHQTDILFYPIVHLANAIISICCCVLAYLIIYKISPSGCKLLGARI